LSDGRHTEPKAGAVTKAVVLVAGLWHGLAAAKAQPKEMHTVGRKPCVQYVAEEMKAAGIREVLFVTAARSVDRGLLRLDPELERRARRERQRRPRSPRSPGAKTTTSASASPGQPNQRGTADAVRLAEQWVGDQLPSSPSATPSSTARSARTFSAA
jgi:UTP-glucose-1-phosphate uridylyltransferase